MSAHIEWFGTSWLSMEVVGPDTEIGEHDTESIALVIDGGGTVAVIETEGEARLLAEMLREAADQLHID